MNTHPARHPTDETLRLYDLGTLDEMLAEIVSKHLEECPECRKRALGLPAGGALDRFRDPDDGSSALDALGPDETRASTLPGGPPSVDTLPPGLANNSDYEIRRELGRGGMGVVYLAHNRLMGRDEVLKVMGRQIMERPGVLDRFVREIRAVAKLRHPNIVSAYSAVRMGDSIVFAMEYVEGLDLSKVIKAKGPLPISHACNFAYQSALGLQHAHDEGLVHRDIKPGNLMLSRTRDKATIKVLDFGLAKVTREQSVESGLTHEGQALGTPDFIAPEQIIDATTADIRADIYSLGCTLYYLLSGSPPFRAHSLYDMFQAHISRDANRLNFVRTEVPAELAALVAKMMAKDPGRRFQTPAEVAEALTPFFKRATSISPIPKTEMSQPAHAIPSRPVPRSSPGLVETQTDHGYAVVPATSALAPEVSKTRRERPIEPRQAKGPNTAMRSNDRVSRPRWLWPSVAVGACLLLCIGIGLGTAFQGDRSRGVAVVTNAPKPPLDEEPPALQGTENSVTTEADSGRMEVTKEESRRPGDHVAPTAMIVETLRPIVAHVPPAKPAHEPPRASGADALQVGSVWVTDPGNHLFTILDRRQDQFKAEYKVGGQIREVNGTIRGTRLRWLARDVRAIVGKPGDDNEGEINGNEIAMAWFHTGGPVIGRYTLRLQKPAPADSSASQTRWIALFNGRDLSGWKTHRSQPGHWRVKNGYLTGSGPETSHLYSERGDFKDFRLIAEARINALGNSGVFGRASFGPNDRARWPLGYEAAIEGNRKNPIATGGLYIGPRQALASGMGLSFNATDWFTLELKVEAATITVLVNDRISAKYVDHTPLSTAGHIALQVNSPQTIVEFRRIEIMELNRGD